MESEDTLDLLAYLARLKRYLVPATIVGLALGVLVGGLGFARPPQNSWRSQAHVLVVPAKPADPAEAERQASLLSNLMRTYVALEDIPLLTERAAKQTGGKFTAQQVADMTSVYWGGGSLLLAVNTTAPDEADAIMLSTAMSDALVEESDRIVGSELFDATLSVAEEAHIDPDLSTVGSRSNALVPAVGAALLGGFLTAFLLELLNSRRRRDRAAVTR
ncbi:hypothetical protein GCM10027030_10420 [Luteococcus sediminum]